jgi:lipase chaperone LimK
MSETDDLLRLHIEALRVLAQTNQPNRASLIERNIEDYLKTELGSERPSLERLRDAIEREEAEKHQGEDWSVAKDYVRSRLSWLA